MSRAASEVEGAEAARARRILAIEFLAFRSAADRGVKKPDADDFMAAIDAIDSAEDREVRRLARGGMVIKAAQGGWDQKFPLANC